MNVLHEIPAENFSLNPALNSGQLFNWRERKGFFYLPHGENFLKLRKNNAFLECEIFAKDEKKVSSGQKKKIVSELFNLERNYHEEVRHLARHELLALSMKACEGLAITRQEPWECLLSFLLTQNSNIPRIRKNVLDLSRKYGKKIVVDGSEQYFFPSPEALAEAKPRGLKKLALGYRAGYVKSVAESVAENGFDLRKIGLLEYDDAKAAIAELDGVGPKVADCVLLFGYGFEQAFPIDTWLRQIMQKHYFGGEGAKKASDKRIGEFAAEEFGEKAGVVHEFFFANRRNLV